jgi:hypothetical protein
LTQIPGIEQRGAFAGERLQRIGQVRLGETIAHLEQPSLGPAEHGLGFRAGQQHRADHSVDVGVDLPDLEALAGQRDGRLDQAPHGQGGEVPVHLEQPLDRAGRGGCAQADVELLGRGPEIGQYRKEVDRFDRAPALWRLDEKIIQAGLALGRAGQQEPAAAERAEHRLGDRRRPEAGEGRIEGIAPVVKDLARGLCRRGMSAGHGPLVRLRPTAHEHHPGDPRNLSNMTCPAAGGNVAPRGPKAVPEDDRDRVDAAEMCRDMRTVRALYIRRRDHPRTWR